MRTVYFLCWLLCHVLLVFVGGSVGGGVSSAAACVWTVLKTRDIFV